MTNPFRRCGRRARFHGEASRSKDRSSTLEMTAKAMLGPIAENPLSRHPIDGPKETRALCEAELSPKLGCVDGFFIEE